MKINLKDNIFWGLGISLVLLFLSSLASYISIKNLIKSSDLVEHSNMVLDDLNSLSSAIKDAETSQRGYLLTGNSAFLEQYNQVKPITASLVNQIKLETEDNPAQQRNVERLSD